MKLLPCEEKEATHVQALPCELDRCEMLNVTPYGIYEILYNDDPLFKGEEMIQTDDGNYACSFSCVIYVKYLRMVTE